MSTAETPLQTLRYNAMAAAANFRSSPRLGTGHGWNCERVRQVGSENHRSARHHRPWDCLHARRGRRCHCRLPVEVTWTFLGRSVHDPCRCWLPAVRRRGCRGRRGPCGHGLDCGNDCVRGRDCASDFGACSCCASDSSRCGDGGGGATGSCSGCGPGVSSDCDCDLSTTCDVGETCCVNVIDCNAAITKHHHQQQHPITMMTPIWHNQSNSTALFSLHPLVSVLLSFTYFLRHNTYQQ